MSGPSIADVLTHHGIDPDSEVGARLHASLLNREEAKCDLLRLAGAQFGLYPQIVAQVLAEVGLGFPIPDEQRALIRQQFVALMEQLRSEND